MHRFVLNGSPASGVAFTASPTLSDGWPSGPQAILIEIACAVLLWLVLKILFDSFNRRRGA